MTEEKLNIPVKLRLRGAWTAASGTHTLNSMLRALFIVAVSCLGDPSHLIRVWLSVLLGVCLISLGYWLALPYILPAWPAVIVLLFAAVVGVAWELHAENSSKRL